MRTGKKIKHRARAQKWHKELHEIIAEQYKALMEKMGISKEEDKIK